jgi:SAM-dependent methyltransferase
LDYSLWTAKFDNKEALLEFIKSDGFQQRHSREMEISEKNLNNESWNMYGYCECCNERKAFLVDWNYSDKVQVNFRERLVCPGCNLNSRQRFVIGHLKKLFSKKQDTAIYLYEQVTPLFKRVESFFGRSSVIGSEYLGYDKRPGEVIKGVRHEDALDLSFKDASLDVIVSNDVYEHVPDIGLCFKEAYRVLNPGGQLLFTIPFHHSQQVTKQRAKLLNGQIQHLEPEAYHGNPVSEKGSLVFYDYGWDIFDTLKETGFKDSSLLMFYGELYGYLGLQFMFTATK